MMNDMASIEGLHSHSALERELRFPKHIVLVDEKFKDLFLSDAVVPFVYHRTRYIQVPTLSFLKRGGVFRNFSI